MNIRINPTWSVPRVLAGVAIYTFGLALAWPASYAQAMVLGVLSAIIVTHVRRVEIDRRGGGA